MFGKLLKYDFRSMLKQFAFIWPAALALAVVNHFTINSFVTSVSEARNTAAGIAMLVYVAILIAMFVITVIFVIQRFYKGLLGDEGYLMHTLPVRPWQLIASKLLCACATTFISIIVALLSIMVIFPWDLDDFREIFWRLGTFFGHWNMQATHIVVMLLELCLLAVISYAMAYLQLYLAMSIGHLFNKNRIAWSVAAFIAINTVVNTLAGSFLMASLDPFLDLIRGMNPMDGFQSTMWAVHITLWVIMAGELVQAAVYFTGTEYILRKRLNLE